MTVRAVSFFFFLIVHKYFDNFYVAYDKVLGHVEHMENLLSITCKSKFLRQSVEY
jgi:hypothetical protein